MLAATLNHLFRTVNHSFLSLFFLTSSEVRAAVLFSGASAKPAAIEGPKKYPRGLQESNASIPTDGWDGHMHIIDPERYPLSADAVYTPSAHSVWDAVTFENTINMKNIVVVQPSIYGFDNSALLDAIRALGPDRSRGVVVFNATNIDNNTLVEWHSLGVRGVRLNLASTEKTPDIEVLRSEIVKYAAIIKPLGWMLQIYMTMDLLPGLQSTINGLGVKVCFDHFAQPSKPSDNSTMPFDPYSITGFQSLIDLLEQGNTYVKFSAPYRVDLESSQLEVVAKEILRVRSDRAVFASDWPHTRFEGLDIKPFEERCLEWAAEAGSVEKVFSTNAKSLWDICD